MKLKEENKIYKWQKKEENQLRRTDVSLSGFYHSKEWRKLREYKLSINPLCQHCLKENKYTKGYVVDHIIPIKSELDVNALDINNLQTLCYNCHQKKTIKDNSKYSPDNIKKGKALQKELNKI